MLLIVDHEKCTGCKQCALACSFTKENMYDPLRSRIKIWKREDIALGLPLLCEQCEAHPCIDSCPERALSRNPKTGVVTVDRSKCKSHGLCVDACPYHGIRLHPESRTPLICDLCGGNPYCVAHCVPGALQWVEDSKESMDRKKKLRSARMRDYKKYSKEVK
ncbi:MAG: 4Fe-4S dicluster domain-containing protein [Candidatus Thorarchaeota archaeon]